MMGVEGAGVADADAVPDADAEIDAERVIVPLDDCVTVVLAVEPADGKTDAVSDGDCGTDEMEGDGEPDASPLGDTDVLVLVLALTVGESK